MLVPEYDEREAAAFVNCTWKQWEYEMTGDEKVLAVAHYRLHSLIEAHVQDAINEKMEHDARMAKNKSRDL